MYTRPMACLDFIIFHYHNLGFYIMNRIAQIPI